MDVVLIAAVASNGVIGADGDVPWHFPADLAHFKETTTGHPVIMGRLTYESIEAALGGPLPDRTNVVLSRGDPDLPEGVRHAESADEALDLAREAGEMVYVIGGASVYEAFFPVATRLVLTEIHEPYPGDTTFPDWDETGWRVASREAHEAFDIVEYVRRE